MNIFDTTPAGWLSRRDAYPSEQDIRDAVTKLASALKPGARVFALTTPQGAPSLTSAFEDAGFQVEAIDLSEVAA